MKYLLLSLTLVLLINQICLLDIAASDQLIPLDQYENEIPQTLQIALDGHITQNQNIVYLGNDSLKFRPLSRNTNLNLQVESSSYDVLEYQSAFHEMLVNGTGNIGVEKTYGRNSTVLSLSDEIYNKEFEMIVNQEVQTDAELSISLTELEFQMNTEDFGFFNMVLEFNTIRVTLNYAGSSIYRNMLTNDTADLYYLINGTSDYIFDIGVLSDFADVEFPSILNKITFNTYLNNIYSLRATFDKISMYQPQDVLRLGEFLIDEKGIQLEIPENTEEEFIMPLDTIANISWDRGTKDKLSIISQLHINSNEISFDAYFLNNDIFPGFSGIYSYIHKFELTSISGNVGLNETHVFLGDQPTNLTLSGKLYRLNEVIIESNPVQNKVWTSNIPISNWTHGSILHSNSNQWKSITITENSFSVLISQSWNKSKLLLTIFHQNSSYISINAELENSPVEIVSRQYWRFETTQEVIIPVVLKNLTSGENFHPTHIITTINGTLRSIDGSNGILIQAGEFEKGVTTLSVNASRLGYVTVEFELTLRIESPNLHIDIQSNRTGEQTAEIIINPYSFSNWTIQAHLQIEGIESANELKAGENVIHVENIDWKADETYLLQIVITLDQNLGIFNYTIPIEGFNDNFEDTSDNSSNILGTTISIISLTGMIATIGYKLYQMKYGEKTISF